MHGGRVVLPDVCLSYSAIEGALMRTSAHFHGAIA
jgi:hypothetical protein